MSSKRLFSRKEFFKHSAMASLGLASAPLLAATGASEEKPRNDQRGTVMKIKDIRPIVLAGRYVFVQVLTEDGISGIGQPSQTGPNNAKVMLSWIESLRNMLVGEDARDIERLWEKMLIGTYKAQGRAMSMAISGVEIALWDILGKSAGLPVCRLLGGVYRDKVRMYATLTRDKNPGNMARRAAAAVESGFTAVKAQVSTRWGFDAKPDTTIESVRLIRKAIGDDVDLIVDANSAWTVPTAIRMCRDLEPFRILFLEQPVPERDLDALAAVNKATDIPITFGEEDWSLWRYKDAIVRGAAEVLQADPIKAAGILTCKKVAILAEAFSKMYTPHNTSKTIGMAATLQIVASVPNARYPHECLIIPKAVQTNPQRNISAGDEINRHLLQNPFEVVNGRIAVPQGPGLGVELNPDIVKKYASTPVDLGTL